MGSPKEFANEQQFNPSRNNRNGQGASPPPLPSKDNRVSYTTTSRDRTNAPYENQPRFTTNQYNSEYPDMIPMQEQQPRVVVRTVRDDESQPTGSFVPIPVQIERSGPQQRHVSPPYHSDPYYRHTNA